MIGNKALNDIATRFRRAFAMGPDDLVEKVQVGFSVARCLESLQFDERTEVGYPQRAHFPHEESDARKGLRFDSGQTQDVPFFPGCCRALARCPAYLSLRPGRLPVFFAADVFFLAAA